MVTEQIKNEILQLTEELIRIPSIQAFPEKIGQCADFIEKWFEHYGIKYQRHDINNVPSIVVLPSGGAKTQVLVMAHFDVVEAENEALFSPWIENGNLYGRGAVDDKYGVALSMILFREHLSALKLKGLSQEHMCFGLILSGDEEVGGGNGVGVVCKNIDADFCITLDGGNPDLIVIKEKGILRLQLEATGKSAHAARPWLGLNAFDVLMEDYLAIKKLFVDQSPDNWHKTMVLTKSTAGNGSANMVPGKAKATLDIRYTEHDDPDQILKAIKELAVSEVSIVEQASLFCGGESPYCDLLLKHSDGAVLGFEHGSSDARYLSEKNIPGAIWGPQGEMSQHTEDEHVVIDSLYVLFDSLDVFFKEIAEA